MNGSKERGTEEVRLGHSQTRTNSHKHKHTQNLRLLETPYTNYKEDFSIVSFFFPIKTRSATVRLTDRPIDRLKFGVRLFSETFRDENTKFSCKCDPKSVDYIVSLT